MYGLALICEYDGTDFSGYQIQDNARSVQACLEEAVKQVYKTDIKVQGCSRTDSGVHAFSHVSSLSVPVNIPAERIPQAINSFLPSDLAVKKAIYVKDGFNARFDNKGKRYIYRIYTSRYPRPLIDRYSFRDCRGMDIGRMTEAAAYFVGEHDFAAFCAAGGSQSSTVRRITSVDVLEKDSVVNIVVTGEAFLYNMVRIIAGTLYEVGIGKISPDEIQSIICSGERAKAGKTLPARGLTLDEVFYDWDKYAIEIK